MLKHRVNDIYKDNLKLFSTNQYILTDEKLSFMSDDLNTFDLITKYDYGAREILTQFLDDTELDYKINDIHEAIYMNLLKNLRKYSLLYSSDEEGEDVVPSADYKITRQYGEEEKHFNYGAKSGSDSYSAKQTSNEYGAKTTTDTFSAKETSNVYGQKTTTDTLGQAQQTVTTAPRSTDSQDQRTTFDSTTDFDTTHNVTGTIQTVDTIADAQRSNSRQEGQHTDTTNEGSHNVQKAEGQHTDTINEGSHTVTKTEATHSDGVVYDEHTDNVYGYKGNPVKNIQTFRKYLDDNTLKTIVAECINTVTYSIYMYTGQM